MTELVRSLVVDDEERIRFTLKKTLQRVGHVVTVAASGEEALELMRETAFDVAIVDLNLGGHVDGLQVIEGIRWRWPETAVVILTAHGSLESAITAIREGVDDYLLKPAKPAEVRSAVQKALDLRSSRRSSKADAGRRTLQRGSFFVDLQQHLATLDGRRLELTPQELKLLVHMMQNDHRVVPPPELVRAVRGFEPESMQEARQIIKWYIHRLRRKVEVDPSQPRHILNVRGVGYKFEE